MYMRCTEPDDGGTKYFRHTEILPDYMLHIPVHNNLESYLCEQTKFQNISFEDGRSKTVGAGIAQSV
jgi:hypothetical protein